MCYIGSSKSVSGTPVDTSAEACSVTSNQSAPIPISLIPNVNTPGSSGQSSTQSNCGDSSWVVKFQIPWSKCQDSLHAAVQRNEPPCGRDLRQLISHTVSDIFSFTRRASRDNLRAIARKIVSHNPKSFADYINGKVVGDGITSVMLMLESKKENLNRQNRQQPSQQQPANSNALNAAGTSSQAEMSTSHRVSKTVVKYGCTSHHRRSKGCTSHHSRSAGCTSRHRCSKGCTSRHSRSKGCTSRHRRSAGCTSRHSRSKGCSNGEQKVEEKAKDTRIRYTKEKVEERAVPGLWDTGRQ